METTLALGMDEPLHFSDRATINFNNFDVTYTGGSWEHIMEQQKQEAETVLKEYDKKYGNPMQKAGVPSLTKGGFQMSENQQMMSRIFPSQVHANNMHYVGTKETVLKSLYSEAQMIKILLDELRGYLGDDEVVMIMKKDYVQKGFKGNYSVSGTISEFSGLPVYKKFEDSEQDILRRKHASLAHLLAKGRRP